MPAARPAKVARETATLDRLSGGRLTLGVGLGSDRFGSELSATGERLDDRLRGRMLDGSLEILTAAWSGEPVHHRGQHDTVDGIQFLPRSLQQPGVPVWPAGFPGNVKPLRRAARCDGSFPVNLQHPDQLAEIVATITELRQHTTAPYDIAVALPPGADPAPYAKAGATWWMAEFPPEAVSLEAVRGVLREGPRAPWPVTPQEKENWREGSWGRRPVTVVADDFYDAELRRHNAHLRAAAGGGPRDRVLDVGCGTGQSTRQAARAAANGSALGVDVSAQALERARRLSHDEGLRNVTYELGDAQTHRFPPAHFDVCISRFGVMFFADPVAAFTNIGRALRPAARLVLLVWQDRDRNEWSSAVRQALTADTATPTPPTGGPGPFSLADPATTQDILTAAGFTEVGFVEVHEPVYYGRDPAAGYDAVLGLREPRDLLAGLDAAAAERARARLRATLAAHDTGSGVLFDSRAWLVTARRR